MAAAKASDPVMHVASLLDNLGLKDDYLLEGAQRRPGYGSQGKAITVEANMFEVRQTKTLDIHHYDVDITRLVKSKDNKMPKPLANKIWLQACQDNKTAKDAKAFETGAFDLQKNIFTPVKFDLDGKTKEIIVGLPEPGRELDDRSKFKVTIKYAALVDIAAVFKFCQKDKQMLAIGNTVVTGLQACQIMFRQDPANRFTPMGSRGRFFGMEGAVGISDGAVVGKGFMQSFRPTEAGNPAIQLDTAYAAFFRSGSLLTLVPEILGLGAGGGGRGGRGGRGGGRGGRGGPPAPGGGAPSVNELSPRDSSKLNKLLFGAKFTLPYKKSPRIFSIKKIFHKPASETDFVLNGKDGAADERIGIVEYYKKHLNITIQKPRLPCVVYGKNFMVPLELVHMSDFNPVPFSSLTSNQAADMIRVAAQRPPDRAKAIKGWRQTLNYNNLAKVKAWGLEVNNNMMTVNARTLPPPRVTYNKGRQLNCQFGGWNLKGVQFTRPGQPLKSWAVVSLDQRFGVQDMQRFISFLCPVLSQYGVNVANSRPPCVEGNRNNVHGSLGNACKEAYMQSKANPQLVVVVLPGRETFLYQDVKHVAGMKLKEFVPTQCLQAQKLKSDRGLDQYCGNVAMKIQAKLGGVTHEVPNPQIFDKTTMMVGADVTHPPQTRGLLQPSIAVTVAGIDADNVRFEPTIRLQEGRQEIIGDLENMIIGHIKAWEALNKAKPAKIIFFRDGVSEGQYMQVMALEVEAIRSAANKIGGGYKPKVTFVVCGKRHNMRFFATKESDADRTGNLQPGTVVDSKVTHPFAFDFYLQAHAGLQGTARPTHYIVLKDENNFTADKMQSLVNNLSYSYARATRSVSLVPVAYQYADIIAGQCRFLAFTDDDVSDTATTTSGKQETRTFDPLLIARRFQNSASKRVGWYM